MWKAIVYKELRENLWVGAAALVVFALMVGTFTDSIPFAQNVRAVATLTFSGSSREPTPFFDDGFPGGFAVLAALFACGLGLRQTLMESVRGTWLVLLNRPIRFERIVAAKLLTGGAIYLVCSAVPILWYGWWAATPGTHASPFLWSMTWPTWTDWLSISTVYLGAFLAGVRPGHWLGSRALPLVGALFLMALTEFVPWGRTMWLATTALLAAILISDILFVARTRDFS